MDLGRKWDLVYHLMCAEAAAGDIGEDWLEEHLAAARKHFQKKEMERREKAVQGPQ